MHAKKKKTYLIRRRDGRGRERKNNSKTILPNKMSLDTYFPNCINKSNPKKHNHHNQLSKHKFISDYSNFIELSGKDTQMINET